jgi:uncharacterized coiled-coil protein SlyX
MNSEQGTAFLQLVDEMEKVMTDQQELIGRAEKELMVITEEYSQSLEKIVELEKENEKLRYLLRRYRKQSSSD